jgi:transketolase C-terminal domain/subunit|tara:strand:- start:6372 stop:6851 length:480 start_codon:yes stop_codon:yes gene_type:complete
MTRDTAYDAATLTVTITESLVLNKKDYGSTQIMTFASIISPDRRIVTVTTTEATVISFAAAMAAGTFIPGKVQYLRFTNLDDTNFINLTFANENDDEAVWKLDKGMSYIVPGAQTEGMVDVLDADSAAISSLTMADLKSVTADADTASCDMEYFLAEIA